LAGTADPLQELLDRVGRVARDSEGLLRQLAGSERRFRALAKAVWQVQEEERRRLARELHDGIGQDLTALKNQLELMAREVGGAGAAVPWPGGAGVAGSPAGGKAANGRTLGGLAVGAAGVPGPAAGGAPADGLAARLAGAVEIAARALNDTRELSRLLRPPILDDLGLIPALAWLARTVGESGGLEVHLANQGGDDRLTPDLEILVFRVAQEALTNVLKHSGAKTAELLLLRQDGWIEVEVADSGRGFDPGYALDPALGAAGSGLRGMRDRLELFGGRLRIQSAPGEGTRVHAAVPLPAAAEPA
jgi:two-component system NarL family sensor kinase